MSEGCQPASDHATSNSSPHRRQDMRRGRPASDCRSRQLGQTAYRSLQPSGRRTASLGRGTTLHLRGGRSMTCRNADGISSRRPPTSRTARSGSSRVMRYHAPRRSFTFKSACKRAHIPAMASPRCVAHLMFPQETPVVLLAPQQQQKPLDPPPVQLADALKGFQTVAVPTQIPTDIPPVDLQQRFDPKDYSGSGIEGGRANGIVVSGSEVYAEALVEERPELLSAPPPIYPQLLRQAGIQGRVMLHAIVDTTGRVEPGSVRIIKSPSPAFDQPTTDWVLLSLFRPSRPHGRR